jgi:hypothetical protein
MDEIITKKCKKCGGTEFYKGRCKICAAVRVKKYYIAHREELCAYGREYAAKHREERAAYRVTHSEEIRAREKQYRATRPREMHALWLACKYNMLIEDYDKMFAAQNGVCAICGLPPNSRKLEVDHDHDTGKIRGLLCHKCNFMLGFAQNDIAILAKAQDYLFAANNEQTANRPDIPCRLSDEPITANDIVRTQELAKEHGW